MHTYQIAESILKGYKSEKFTQERLDFLLSQAKEQLEEIAQNEVLYNHFLEKAKVPSEDIDPIITWMLLMSNEDICEEYIDEFRKNFREIIPVSDLADLLFYNIYLKRVEEKPLQGFDYLLHFESEGVGEIDQYCFTNILLYVQKSKEVAMEF